MAFESNISSPSPLLDPCCDPKNPSVVLPSSDVRHDNTPLVLAVISPVPDEDIPPEPPPILRANKCLSSNNNNDNDDNDNTPSRSSSPASDSSDIMVLRDWLITKTTTAVETTTVNNQSPAPSGTFPSTSQSVTLATLPDQRSEELGISMTPVKSELDYDSDSDISSDMEEVLGNNNDIEMATARWTGAQCNSARITRTMVSVSWEIIKHWMKLMIISRPDVRLI